MSVSQETSATDRFCYHCFSAYGAVALVAVVSLSLNGSSILLVWSHLLSSQSGTDEAVCSQVMNLMPYSSPTQTTSS